MNDGPKKVPGEDPPDPFEGRLDLPFDSPVQPHQLRPRDDFRFDCHPGVPCFNACCRNVEITLTPYDILRLKRRFHVTAGELVASHTVPFEMDHHDMPGLRLATKPGSTECVFLAAGGCSVYDDRPAACRYYALGRMAVRRKDSAEVEDVYFVVKEDHCKGHLEPRTRTVAEYRAEQGLERYDAMNREWQDIVIKKRSAGPAVGAPSARSLQLFDMCSYDMDSFRQFIQTPGFVDVFDLDEATRQALMVDEDELLAFAMRFLKQVLFGEMTIPVKDGARERRLAARRDVLLRRREEAVAGWKAEQEALREARDEDPGDGGASPAVGKTTR